MGWTDEHLNRFVIQGREYGVAHLCGVGFADDLRWLRLAHLGPRTGERFLYEYDFRDGWQHDVRVEQILRAEAGRRYPVCIGGRRAAPPEDCGGPWAFLELRQRHSIFHIAERLYELCESGTSSDERGGELVGDHYGELVGLCRWLKSVGRRPRTRYQISPPGEEALRRWLGTRAIAPIELESEALLRVWFGRFGTIEDLRNAIQNVQAQAQANLRWGASIAQEYLVEGVPAERGHISALTFRFLWDFNVMLEAWATWGQRELSGWGDVEPTAERMDRAAAILREALAERLSTPPSERSPG